MKSLTKKRLLIFGVGGQALDTYSLAESVGYRVSGFIHDNPRIDSLAGKRVYRDIFEVGESESFYYAVAIGENQIRAAFVSELRANHPWMRFPALIDATASISSDSKVSEGAVVFPQATISYGASVGAFTILGVGSYVGHGSQIGEYCFLGPGASVAGDVRMERLSAIGMKASVREKASLGQGSILGSHSFLNEDLKASTLALGIPAKPKMTVSDDFRLFR